MNWPKRSQRPSGCSSPAAGWRSSPSIRSKTASSSASSPSAPASCRASRHCPDASAGAAPSFTLLFKGHRERQRSGDRARNPRARSAKLRAGERTAAPPHAARSDDIGVPHIAGAPLMLKIFNAILVLTVLRLGLRALFARTLDARRRTPDRASSSATIADEREAIKLLNAEWSKPHTAGAPADAWPSSISVSSASRPTRSSSSNELSPRIPAEPLDQARRPGQGYDRRHSEGDGVSA